jgi:hypothetical protein
VYIHGLTPRCLASAARHLAHMLQRASLSGLFRHDHSSRTVVARTLGHWPMLKTSVANNTLSPLKSSIVYGKSCSCCRLSSDPHSRVWCSMSSVQSIVISMKIPFNIRGIDLTFSSRSDQSFSTSMKFCSGPLDLMRPW